MAVEDQPAISALSMHTPETPARVARWSRTERAVHWIHAAAFCTLLSSGLCLYLPSAAEAVGRRPLLKSIHLWTALVWAVALVAVFVLGDRPGLRRTAREVEFLDSGRLNVGQKLNAIATAASRSSSPSAASSSGSASATTASGSRTPSSFTTT